MNLMNEALSQLNGEVPKWFVQGAGTGGTISSVGKFVTRYRYDTKIAFVDPEYSLFFDWVTKDKFGKPPAKCLTKPNRIHGIGWERTPLITGDTTRKMKCQSQT